LIAATASAPGNESPGWHASTSPALVFFFGFKKEGLLIESFEFKFFFHSSTHFLHAGCGEESIKKAGNLQRPLIGESAASSR
jgi:hypothetical protein